MQQNMKLFMLDMHLIRIHSTNVEPSLFITQQAQPQQNLH